jgi:hypothetical protein
MTLLAIACVALGAATGTVAAFVIMMLPTEIWPKRRTPTENIRHGWPIE